jgi:F-type H+-transporting ATPase subunit delta
LATRYATALFALAREQRSLDAVARDLDAVAAALAESDELRRLVATPLLSRAEQGRAVGLLAEQAGLQDLTRRFLGVLAENRRLQALPAVVAAFRSLLAAERGEVEAEIVSAAPLTDEQVGAVEGGVRRFAGRQVRLTRKVDPGLLGGLVVRVGSRMVDASLRSRLVKLEQSMRGL